ncbi:hypothetical protein OJF2_20640 [Aquisphaera giovannonii]|uniref:Uncharacterized protein n=1 Tax=Aquisphaera giovannonii TaxID=406548 RepID=A0A5B9VZ09_9BACT|nr:hypothetical protein [Aquisphaera giovannonii]QEH33562.1 hypothetical protein OJF2_20640 [Aquisphaera giovannonii]
MGSPDSSADGFLSIGPRIRVLPIIHGSGDFAIRVRDELLERPYDCLAVPLPPSFQDEVERAVEALPTPSVVVQPDADGEEGEPSYSFVPIDPCQGVIAGLRTALGERIAREFIDLETPSFESIAASFPDPYALKRVSPEKFAAAVLPAIPPPQGAQHRARLAWMGARLREIESRRRLTLLVCSLLDWPWIRDAYRSRIAPPEPEPFFAPIRTHRVDSRSLLFLLGELPFITGLYERGRRELTADDNLSVDGVKELMLEARERLRLERPDVAQRITPQLLSVAFRYIRNLSLLERRLTPDLYTLIVAARQTAGDDYALALAETARQYLAPVPSDEGLTPEFDEDRPLRMGVHRADVPGCGPARMTSRLPGQAISWRTCKLRPKPSPPEQRRWKQRWDPFGMCSWPPEDDRIEGFHRHVRDQACAILGADLARVEKFTTSVRDGIDIRETLRNWHKGELYVRVVPPSRGSIEAVVFLFDVPADPDVYTHRATWFAEHSEESTLAFYATDPMKDLVGPGIARAKYGGALFLFPPRPIPEIWTDPQLESAATPEERLLAAAFLHSRDRHVAVVSPAPPLGNWRRMARASGRKIVHLPLKRFGGQMLDRLRTFHVLNGKQVRSYAADYIRDA